jgi:hypothetical protein
VHEALIDLENSICNKDAESQLEKELDSFIMKNLPSEFLEPSDTIRIPNIMRLLKMDMHHVNGSPDLGGISQAVLKVSLIEGSICRGTPWKAPSSEIIWIHLV